MPLADFLEDLDSRIEKAKPGLIRWTIVIGVAAVVLVAGRWAWSEYRERKHRDAWETFSSHVFAGGGTVMLSSTKEDSIPAVREATGGPWADLAAAYQSALGDAVFGGTSGGFDFTASLETLEAASSDPRVGPSVRNALLALGEGGQDGLTQLEQRLSDCKAWFEEHPRLRENSLPEGSSTVGFALSGGTQFTVRLDPAAGVDRIDSLLSLLTSEAMKGASWEVDLTDDLWKLRLPDAGGEALQEEAQKVFESFRDSSTSISLFSATLCVIVDSSPDKRHTLALTRKDGITDYALAFRARPIGYVSAGSEQMVASPDVLSPAPLVLESITATR